MTGKVKCSRYRPGVAQRVDRSIALLFHDRGTWRGELSAARPGRTLPPGKDLVPILQGAGWTPGPVWTGGKSRPHRDSIPDRPARSQSLYGLSYPAHSYLVTYLHFKIYCSMTAAIGVGEWSAARPGRSLPPGKTWYQFYRRVVGSQGRSGRAENLVATGIRSRTVQPVAQSLYRQSYPAHSYLFT